MYVLYSGNTANHCIIAKDYCIIRSCSFDFSIHMKLFECDRTFSFFDLYGFFVISDTPECNISIWSNASDFYISVAIAYKYIHSLRNYYILFTFQVMWHNQTVSGIVSFHVLQCFRESCFFHCLHFHIRSVFICAQTGVKLSLIDKSNLIGSRSLCCGCRFCLYI